MSSSVKRGEIEKFSRDAPQWWNEKGPFAPLHALNPVRMAYIREQIGRHYGLDEKNLKPFKGYSVLDIGCGGGLVCEPMARLGANVTGIDADAEAIKTAQAHAKKSGLDISYECGAAEQIKKKFDVVLALEIIEHVNDPQDFAQTCAKLAKADGIVIFSTLNRTAKSFALGIVAAEYILRWVPQGTHSWKKFIRPSELARHARFAGLKPMDVSGMVYDPIKGQFKISKNDTAVNYFMSVEK